MIDKVANNDSNQEELNLNPPQKIKEKLDYYRTLFRKTHDFSDNDFNSLKKDVKKFFNLKFIGVPDKPPSRLVRVSNNNQILEAQGRELSFLTDISQLLAPPAKRTGYGRCNIPDQRTLYCAVSEASAYWEVKPKKGDVITISHFEIKPETTINCSIIGKKNEKDSDLSTTLKEVYYLLREFFIDAYSLEVSRDCLRDYLFSSLLSSELLFYPIPSDKNIEAIIYPSVQKKKFGQNFAIRNDLIFEKYTLLGVETRFILDEFENIDPESEEHITDNLIGSFGTKTFDYESGGILYKDNAKMLFELFRNLQINGSKQQRFGNSGNIENLAFDLSVSAPKANDYDIFSKKKIGRNDFDSVVYQNGINKGKVKYKFVERDIEKGMCQIFWF